MLKNIFLARIQASFLHFQLTKPQKQREDDGKHKYKGESNVVCVLTQIHGRNDARGEFGKKNKI